MKDSQIAQMWGNYAAQASQYYSSGRKLTPWDILAKDMEQREAYLNTPRSVTQTSTAYDMSTREDAHGIFLQAAQSLLGRDPTKAEIGAFQKALNAYEKKNPTVTTQTTNYWARGDWPDLHHEGRSQGGRSSAHGDGGRQGRSGVRGLPGRNYVLRCDDGNDRRRIMAVNGADIADWAKQWTGTPYVWGGNSLSNGVDCSGLVQQIYKHFGVNVSRTTYSQIGEGKAVGMNELQAGDMVFFDTQPGRRWTRPCRHLPGWGQDDSRPSPRQECRGCSLTSGYYQNSFMGGRRVERHPRWWQGW